MHLQLQQAIWVYYIWKINEINLIQNFLNNAFSSFSNKKGTEKYNMIFVNSYALVSVSFLSAALITDEDMSIHVIKK